MQSRITGRPSKYLMLSKNLISLCNIDNVKANSKRKYWKQYYQTKIKETYARM